MRKDLKAPKDSDSLMVISNQEIAYCVKNIKTKETKLIKTDKIEFYEGFENDYSLTEMVNPDNELWMYIVDESSNSLHLIQTGTITSSGRKRIDIDNKEAYYSRIK